MAIDDDVIGVHLTSGPQDWQIIQQDPHGQGTLALEGEWRSEVPGVVEARLVSESTGMPVTHALDWQRATMRANTTWQLTLTHIPAGGLY